MTCSDLNNADPLDGLLHPLSVPPFPQRHPGLEEQMTFENDVSWVRRKLMLNGNLVSSGPKRVQRRPYATPKDPSKTTPMEAENGAQLPTGVGVPVLRPKASRTALEANRARWQLKKMWLASS